ncbi:MAG: TatD family hydrolase [Verrucomicrobia bacterium]|nr:TatD family hydrolase [Verrucomicrobiota bacterium]
MTLFDAHNHLQDEALAPHLPSIMPELQQMGLSGAVVNGTRESDWERVAALAEAHPWVLPSYGLHPWFLKERSPHWREHLTGLITSRRAAMGEIGLDRWIEGFDREDQAEVFAWQMNLATQHNLPTSIHCLKAWGALWDHLRTHPVPECGFLLHSYGGPAEMVDGFVRRGAYFSFSGHLLRERKTAQREIFRHIPAERLLVETDAPDMHLPPERIRYHLPETPEGGILNHPANLLAIYEGLAELRGWTLETLSSQVAENFRRLFGGV